MARQKESEIEQAHGHCADVFIADFGIPKGMRKHICDEIAKVWKQNTMIHCVIIASIRGYQPRAATRGLQMFLERHATREQKHKKREHVRQSGTFDSRGYYHPSEPSYDDY